MYIELLLPAAVILALYTVLAVFYKRLHRVNAFARRVVHRIRRPWMRPFFIFTHKYADIPAASAQISGLALLLGFVWGDWRSSTALLVSLFLQTAIVTVTKSASGRVRPPHDTAHVFMASGSYPSGHAAGSLTFAVLAPILLSYHVPPVIVVVLSVYLLIMAGFVAFGRLYLDMHWLTDLIGGWLLSIVTIMFTLAMLP